MSRNTTPATPAAPAPYIGLVLSCVKKELTHCDMKPGIVEGNAKDIPNYHVTWTIMQWRLQKLTAVRTGPKIGISAVSGDDDFVVLGLSFLRHLNLRFDFTHCSIANCPIFLWHITFFLLSIYLLSGPVWSLRCFMTPGTMPQITLK